MYNVLGFVIAYFCRWLPHPAEPGLRRIGNPGPLSPIIVTSNFSLTLKRVVAALRGRHLWLLVVNSDGINVWCAAAGNTFTTGRLVDAIKVSRLADMVLGREIILPALSAPAIDRREVKRATGFRSTFGPVMCQDLPEYLGCGNRKTEEMRGFPFNARHRADMLLSMNLVVFLAMAAALLVLRPGALLGAAAIFWSAVLVLYFFNDRIPGRTGWGQALFAASHFAAAWAIADLARGVDPLAHWQWFAGAYAIFMLAGLDLAGIAAGRKSDPERLLHRLGVKSMGDFLKEKDIGDIRLEMDKCVGCGTCFDICPNRVFAEEKGGGKALLARPDDCFNCGACVRQCPEDALAIVA